MRSYQTTRIAIAFAALALLVNQAHADEFSTQLSGFNELGAQNNETGAILTNGTGKASLEVGRSAVQYRLSYSNLTSAVLQAHIHFGKVHSTGGIMVFFCNSVPNNPSAPAGTPACPNPSGTVSGTWTAASVIAVAKQNVPAGNFQALLDALKSNTAYANLHTVNFPAGEIRGQIREGESDD